MSREPKTGYDTETVKSGTTPDPESPFYDAQVVQASSHRELLQDRATRYSDVNPPITSLGHIAAHPREFEPYKILERPEAMHLLGVDSAGLSRLVRRGVVRRAHPASWAGLVYDDVALLASTEPGTDARTDIEVRLRMQNIDNYLTAFSPNVYYNLDGTPKTTTEMDDIDKEGRFAYQEGLVNMPAKFKSVLRPVPFSQSKDHKVAHDVQFLYMADEASPHMSTALLMRRWYRETHPQARYNVARVAIPPASAMGRPEHAGVMKFLVEAASILYQIDFESIPGSYYAEILDMQTKLEDGTDSDAPMPNLYSSLTGAQISTEGDLHALLATQDSTAALPLRYQVAAWYQAYNNLMSNSKAPAFAIIRVKYIDALIYSMTGTKSSDFDQATMVTLRRKVEQIIGCSPDVAPFYRPERPPLYVGEPPSYWEASGNRRLHKRLVGSQLPYNVEILMAANSLADASPEKLEEARILNNLLPGFHAEIASMMPPTTLVKQDKLVVTQLFASLNSHGVEPHSLYMYPYRDSHYLANGLEEKLKKTLADMRDMSGAMPERSPAGGLIDMPNPNKVQSLVLSNVTDDLRDEYAYEFANNALGFTDEDLAGMTSADILDSLPDTQALDEYIVKSHANIGDAGEAAVIDLDSAEKVIEL